MQRNIAVATALLIVAGALGGALATLAHLPMPWMTGSLLVGVLIVRFLPDSLPQGYRFPVRFRMIFIAIIGVTIGLQVHRDLLAQIPALILSLTAITAFVPLAQFGNYYLFRRAGGFDRPTAFFAGAPGGLMEALLMGEQNGADAARLTLQQFLRIIVVITLIPAAISIWVGHPVGSAAGISGQMPQSALAVAPTLLILCAVGALGLALATRLHIPAAQLTGPLLAAAVLNFVPLPQLAMPFWGLIAAQVVIGVSLGTRFHGLSTRMVTRGMWLAGLSVIFMLALAAVLVGCIVAATGLAFDTMLISFAPGGVTEMSLIAVSLAASPAVVALHHIYRIILTVILMATMARWLGVLRTPPPPPPSPSG